MRPLIALSGALFVGLGAIILVTGVFMVATSGPAGLGAGMIVLAITVGGGAATVLIGGLTWIATQQDARLERIEALLRARFQIAPQPTPMDAGQVWDSLPRRIVIGTDQPGPMPATLPALPPIGTEAAPGWYHRAYGSATIWHPGGPVSDEAHQRR